MQITSFIRERRLKMTARSSYCPNHACGVLNREIGFACNLNYLNAIRRLDIIWPPKSDQCRASTSPNPYDEILWESPIFGSAFCPLASYADVMACATEDGKVMLWKVDCNPTLISCTPAHNNAIFDTIWHPLEKKLITVSGDNTAALWDIGTSCLQGTRQFLGHGQTVKSCSFNQESPDILGTGDRQGCVFIWDVRTGDVENKISPAHERKVHTSKGKLYYSRSSVTGLSFFQNFLITVSAGSPKIKLWDLRKFYKIRTQKPQPIVEFPHDTPDRIDGFSYLCYDYQRQRIFITSTSNCIYSYHLNSLVPKPIGNYVGMTHTSFYVKSAISPDGKYLLSGSCSDTSYMWETEDIGPISHQPIRTLITDSKEVNSVSWSSSGRDPFLIVTCGESKPFTVWGIPNEEVELDDTNVNQLAQQKQVIANDVQNILDDDDDDDDDDDWTPVRLTENKDFGKRNDGESTILNTPNKRSLRVMMDNSPPGSCNKRYKAKCTSSSVNLFPTTDVNCNSKDSDGSSYDTTLCKPMNQFTQGFSSLGMSKSCPDVCDIESRKVSKESVIDSVSNTNLHDNMPFSPTSNLPNYVVDGTSPSHVCKPRRKENVDWLTKLRSEKKASSVENELVKTVVNARVKKQTDHVRKPPEKQHGNILKFLTVLGKSNDDRRKASHGDSEGSDEANDS